MSFGEAVQKGILIVRLDRATIREVAGEPEAFSPAVLITIVAGLALWLCPVGFSVAGIVTGPLRALALVFLGGALFHFVASLFNGRGEYLTLVRTWGVTRVLGWVRIVPYIGWIIDLWSFVVLVVILEELYGLNRTQALLTVVIPLLALSILGAIFFVNLVLLRGLLSLGRFF